MKRRKKALLSRLKANITQREKRKRQRKRKIKRIAAN